MLVFFIQQSVRYPFTENKSAVEPHRK